MAVVGVTVDDSYYSVPWQQMMIGSCYSVLWQQTAVVEVAFEDCSCWQMVVVVASAD